MNTTEYHETLWAAVKAATDAIPAGHAVDHEAMRGAFEPMGYETSQRRLIPLATCERRNRRTTLAVSIYRMPSGRYETTAYAT